MIDEKLDYKTTNSWEDSVRLASRNFKLGREHTLLLQRLTAVHGPVRVSRERSGIHYNFASPIGLKNDGTIELVKKHCSLNADKYISDPKKNDFCALCHKYEKGFSVSELLQMRPVEERIPVGVSVNRKTSIRDPRASLKYDENGNPIPESVGSVVPINQLPPNHVAAVYLMTRKGGPFDLDLLHRQFRCSYCTSANAERTFAKMPNGFLKSPEGRIIFFIDQYGKERGWQARVLEIEHNGDLFYYNPHKDNFLPVYRKSSLLPEDERDKTPKGIDKKWTLKPPYSSFKGFALPKYLIALGGERGTSLLGFDGALGLSLELGFKGIFLTEGPMDAARIFQAGFPAACVMGKYFSTNQASLVANSFEYAVICGDNDDGGDTLVGKTISEFDKLSFPYIVLPPTREYEDPGETPVEVLKLLINKTLQENL